MRVGEFAKSIRPLRTKEKTNMKRKMTLSLMLALSMLLSLVGFATTAQGQQPKRRPILDTGLVTLGFNQVLRVSVAAGDVNGDGSASIAFREITYMPVGCDAGVCKHTIASQNTTSPVELMLGEASCIDGTSNTMMLRIVVLSNNPSVRVNAVIVDLTTGNIIAILVAK
jgi:hypothetical protein